MFDYKGEDSLRRLDIPAYERRSAPVLLTEEEGERERHSRRAEASKIHRVQIDKLKDKTRADRNGKTDAKPNKPLFLDKDHMMD